MAAPTEKELEILPKFRENLKDLNLQGFWNTDLGLLKWLRARDLNLVKSEELLRKSLKWRQDYHIETILTWKPPPDLLGMSHVEFCGYDMENAPICYFHFGRWDLRKIYNMGYREAYLKYSAQVFERIVDMMKNKVTPSGLPVTQFVLIVDNQGLAMKTLASIGAMNMSMESTANFEQNHPETLKKAIIINGNRVFVAFFALMKPIMSQRTFGKIEVYDSRMEIWKKALLNGIAEDQLPKEIVEKWKNPSDQRVTVSPEIMSKYKSEVKEEFVSVNVGAGEKISIRFEVMTPQSILYWSFVTENYDIGFSLIHDHSSSSSSSKVLVPYSKVNSNLEEQEESIVCERLGTYTFVFDNSYSRYRGKVVKYRIANIVPQKC